MREAHKALFLSSLSCSSVQDTATESHWIPVSNSLTSQNILSSCTPSLRYKDGHSQCWRTPFRLVDRLLLGHVCQKSCISRLARINHYAYQKGHSNSFKLTHDMGAGCSIHSPTLARNFQRVHVSDVSPSAITAAEELLNASPTARPSSFQLLCWAGREVQRYGGCRKP